MFAVHICFGAAALACQLYAGEFPPRTFADAASCEAYAKSLGGAVVANGKILIAPGGPTYKCQKKN